MPVNVTLLVDGQTIPSKWPIVRIETQRVFNRVPWAEIVLVEDVALEQELTFRNDESFEVGKSLEIKLRPGGNEGKDQKIFKGIITGSRLRNRARSRELILQVHDVVFQTTLHRNNALFTEMTDSGIMSEILSAYPEITIGTIEGGEVEHPEMIQYNSSDWDFILARADANGLCLLAEDGKVSILPPKKGSDHSLTLGKDELLEMELSLDMRWALNQAKAIGWNADEQELQSSPDAKRSAIAPGKWAAQNRPDSLGKGEVALLFPAPLPAPELQSYAQGHQARAGIAAVRGTLTVRGNAAYRLGQGLKLEKVAAVYDGETILTGIRHSVTVQGWETHLQIGLEPYPFAQQTQFHDLPASGLLPAVPGLQLGKVDQFTKDDSGQFRIRVMLPGLAGKKKYQWARWTAPDAGDARGVMFRPEKGDEVVVGFLNQDPRHPIVLGALHSQNAPPPTSPDDANTFKGIYTRSRIKLQFDDEKKVLRIETPGEQFITLDDENSQILLQNKKSEVKMNDDGVLVKTNGKFTVDAQGDILLKTPSNLTFQAAQVKTK